jgi:hypothetical protein
MVAHPHDAWLREMSIRILGRLQEHGGDDRIFDLYKSGAGKFLSELYDQYAETDEPDSDLLAYILSELVLQMLE